MSVGCRLCGSVLTHGLIDLGLQPLANSYLEPTAEAVAAERAYPLRVMICHRCFLVQVEQSIPAETIFHDDYAYHSSYSVSWVAHAQRYAHAMIERFDLGRTSTVVEVASNDGYLLQHFLANDVRCLGVEPAGRCAEVARAKGIDTVAGFFDRGMAGDLSESGHRADLVVANNVLAHVPDLDAFVAGFPVILKADGVITFEFPHLLRMIAATQFDAIYHEHYSYLSLSVVERLLSNHGLRVFDVEHLPTHGGSLRVFACHARATHSETAAVCASRQEEKEARLDRLDGYRGFAERAATMRDELCAFLAAASARGEKVAAYGAAAKGNTFLNFCGVGASEIAFVVDRNPEKQGRLLPGSHIPVRAPEVLVGERPDLILVLPWNLVDEIAAECAWVADWGGRFFVAAPTLREL